MAPSSPHERNTEGHSKSTANLCARPLCLPIEFQIHLIEFEFELDEDKIGLDMDMDMDMNLDRI